MLMIPWGEVLYGLPILLWELTFGPTIAPGSTPAFSPDYYNTHAQSAGFMSGDMVSSNDNSSTGTPVDSNAAPFSPTATVVVGLLTSLMALLTIVGNGFTLVVFALSRSLRKFGHFFVINLAIADLAIGVLAMPPGIHYLLTGTWQGGHAFCKFWLIWDYVTTAASSLCICVISIDRYLLVVHPLLYRRIQSKSLQVIMLAIPWGVVLLLYVPSILCGSCRSGPRFGQEPVTHRFLITFHFFFLHSSWSSLSLIPSTITSVLIFWSLRRHLRKVSDLFISSRNFRYSGEMRDQGLSEKRARRVKILTIQSPRQLSARGSKISSGSQEDITTNDVVDLTSEVKGHTQSFVDDTGDAEDATTKLNSSRAQPGSMASSADRRSVKSSGLPMLLPRCRARKDIRVALSLFVLVLVFTICWIPYEIIALVMVGCHDCVNKDLYAFSSWLLWFNSTINPVLYLILHTRFREAAAIVIAGCWECESCHS
ncbi:LOW QUALITY PROTEIN: histamine H3 receptor-like [Pomacea canaliculata]|uniref:LOW QUALITY PROTEIN: histamine H3 receptor-like n=1 Tax=Pomacea canaliculata TaxID=400727 RepID=UPI000D726F02|nr:LOW QUALITY PROTEIN: histamine H3 receptor-like [Pomacea canaliculata]